MYDATKLADPTRPVLDASGYSHRVRGADIYDSHSYEQDPQRFREEQAGLAEGRPHANRVHLGPDDMPFADGSFRSEERRVGKGCRARSGGERERRRERRL